MPNNSAREAGAHSSEAHHSDNSTLNEAQRLRLRITCQYVDKLLGEIEEVLHASASKSPFPRYIGDITLAQTRVLEHYIQRLRDQLVRSLAWQHLRPEAPHIPASRAVLTHLNFIDIAFEELRPSYMHGSGAIQKHTSEELTGIVQELRSIVEGASSYMRQESGRSLDTRIEELDGAGRNAHELGDIAKIIERYGLVEFRGRVAALIGRLEHREFEAAFFGRVSSGKSSLLNALLQRDVLPVGVNPITAVPTKVRSGTHEGAAITFLNGETRQIPLNELAAFVTESGNPGNKRGVTSAFAEVVSQSLQSGITLVDTPGLGSLARSGARETLAYLPSADLALLLVDAGATLSEEDVGTLRMLLESGTPTLVLLSKADLLDAADRQRACTYMEEHLLAQLGVQIKVHAITALSTKREMLHTLYTSELRPRFQQAEKLRRESTQRKLAALQAAVAATLETMQARGEGITPSEKVSLHESEQHLRLVIGRLSEQARAAAHDALRLRDTGNEVLARVARSAMHHLKATREPYLRPALIKGWMEAAVDQQVQPMLQRLNEAATHAIETLREVGTQVGHADLPVSGEIDRILRDLPRFEWSGVLEEVRPWYMSILGSTLTEWLLRHKWSSGLGTKLIPQLEAYGRALTGWERQATANLEAIVGSYAGVVRSQLHRMTEAERERHPSYELIEQDLQILRVPSEVNRK